MTIPTKRDYDVFLEEFADGLKSFTDVSFFTYGSHLRKDFVAGVSDIDGFIVLENNFITDKDAIKELSSILDSALRRSNTSIRTQFNVLDEGIAKDGRFLAYSKDYVNYFKKSAVKLHGSYNLENMNGFDFKVSELVSIAHNLHKVRQGFLYNDVNHYFKKKDFYENEVKSPLKKVSQLPKQLINLSTGNLIEDKDKSLEEFLKEFPEYNGAFVMGVNKLMKNPIKYEEFVEEDESITFSRECLTEMEKMIQVYVKKFPTPRKNEVRDGFPELASNNEESKDNLPK